MLAENNFPKYDIKFQEAVIHIALKDEVFANILVKYLKDDKELGGKLTIFSAPSLNSIFEGISDSIKKYKTKPSEGQLITYINENYTEMDAIAANKHLSKILKMEITDEKFYRDELSNFIKVAYLMNGMALVREKWKKSPILSNEVMLHITNKVSGVKFDKEDTVTGQDFFEMLDQGFEETSSGKIKTLIPELDNLMLGGMPRGGLTLILGGTNSGKSMFAIDLGCAALKQGFKVFHVHMDGKRSEAMIRYFSNLSQVPIKKLYQKDLTKEETEHLKQATQQYGDNLKIKIENNYGLTIEALISELRDVYKTYKFDMLVIDYAGLLKTEVKYDKYNLQTAEVHRALAALSRELDCLIITPSQATRDAQKRQNGTNWWTAQKTKADDKKPIMRSTDVSDSDEVGRVAEVIFSLNRTDDEIGENKMRLFLEKQRDGEKGKIFGLYTDYSCCRLNTGKYFDPNASIEETELMDTDEFKNSAPEDQKRMLDERRASEQSKKSMVYARAKFLDCNAEINTLKKGIAIKKEMTSLPEGEVKKAEAKLESKIKESQALKEEMIKYIKLSYPNANKELYLRIKEQVKDAKASGENSGKSYKEAEATFLYLSYLFEEG